MEPLVTPESTQSERLNVIRELDTAWNSGDLDYILSFYSEDFVLTSPVVRTRLGIADGTLRGKLEVRSWWQRCLAKFPQLGTELLTVVDGPDHSTMAYVYRLIYPGSSAQPVVSIFSMNEANKVCREVFYAEAPA